MLETAGCATDHAKGGADVLIVQTTIESVKSKDTVLIGDDTDLLVLLIHYADMDAHKVIFAPEPKANSKKNKIWDIQKTKLALGVYVCSCILFVHAVLGCDTASRVFGFGKGLALKNILANDIFRDQAEVFKQTGNVRRDQEENHSNFW